MLVILIMNIVTLTMGLVTIVLFSNIRIAGVQKIIRSFPHIRNHVIRNKSIYG